MFPIHSGEFRFLSSRAPEDRRQCLPQRNLAPYLLAHDITRMKPSQVLLCGEPGVKKNPQGRRDGKNVNKWSEEAWTNDTVPVTTTTTTAFLLVWFCFLLPSRLLKKSAFAVYLSGAPEQDSILKDMNTSSFSLFLHVSEMWHGPYLVNRIVESWKVA